MKYSKMLGLAAVAAVALIAIVGAGSASATVLCKKNQTPCGLETYGKVAFKASLESETTEFFFDLGPGKSYSYTCTGSVMEGNVTTPGSELASVIITLGTFTLTECTCPETTVLSAGSLDVTWTSGTMNGGMNSANLEVTFNCMGHCKYGDGKIGVFTGGAMGTLDISAVLNKVEGGENCPETAKWTGSYTVTAPEPVWVAQK